MQWKYHCQILICNLKCFENVVMGIFGRSLYLSVSFVLLLYRLCLLLWPLLCKRFVQCRSILWYHNAECGQYIFLSFFEIMFFKNSTVNMDIASFICDNFYLIYTWLFSSFNENFKLKNVLAKVEKVWNFCLLHSQI